MLVASLAGDGCCVGEMWGRAAEEREVVLVVVSCVVDPRRRCWARTIRLSDAAHAVGQLNQAEPGSSVE